MIRFVDLTEALGAGPACALLDTVDDRFEQRSDGSHVLENLDDVREAAGERGVALVPAGFFDAPEDDDGPFCAECRQPFAWNDEADRDEPDPLCDGCAHKLAGERRISR